MTVKINLRSISPSLGLTSRVSEWDASRKGYATRIRSEYQLVKLRGHAQLVWIVMKAALRRPTGEVDVRCMKYVQEERKGKSFFWGEGGVGGGGGEGSSSQRIEVGKTQRRKEESG